LIVVVPAFSIFLILFLRSACISRHLFFFSVERCRWRGLYGRISYLIEHLITTSSKCITLEESKKLHQVNKYRYGGYSIFDFIYVFSFLHIIMVEQLKFIVEQLKRPPFNRKDYNILTFDNLTNNQLLQVLTDVFGVIDPYDPSV
jgi:hypothetical protein